MGSCTAKPSRMDMLPHRKLKCQAFRDSLDWRAGPGAEAAGRQLRRDAIVPRRCQRTLRLRWWAFRSFRHRDGKLLREKWWLRNRAVLQLQRCGPFAAGTGSPPAALRRESHRSSTRRASTLPRRARSRADSCRPAREIEKNVPVRTSGGALPGTGAGHSSG